MELDEKASNESGTNGVLPVLLLVGKLFCFQFLYRRRAKRWEERGSQGPLGSSEACDANE